MWAPTKIQSILHALVSQISSFWNYESSIQIKIVREKTWFLRFIRKRDSWELILWLRALEINLERNWDCEELLKDGILKKINK